MPIEKHFGSITFRTRVPLSPWDRDSEFYASKAKGRISVLSKDCTQSIRVGTIRAQVVKLAEALHDNAELCWVLDAFGLEEIYEPLFDGDGRFVPDLNIEAEYGDLLVIENITIDRHFDDAVFRQQIIETAIATFASVAVVLIKKKLLGLGAKNRFLKGYQPLEGTSYLVRDNRKRHHKLNKPSL